MNVHPLLQIKLLWLACLLIVAAPLAAQPAPVPGAGFGSGQSAPGFDRGRLMMDGTDQRQRLRRQRRRGGRWHPERRRERLNTLKMWKMTEYLELSESQAEKFFPLHRAQQLKVDELSQRRHQLHDDLRGKIQEGKIEARDIDRFVEATAELEKSRIDLQALHVKAMARVLSDGQRAKFVVFDDYFMRQLRRGIEDEFARGGPPPAP